MRKFIIVFVCYIALAVFTGIAFFTGSRVHLVVPAVMAYILALVVDFVDRVQDPAERARGWVIYAVIVALGLIGGPLALLRDDPGTLFVLFVAFLFMVGVYVVNLGRFLRARKAQVAATESDVVEVG